MNGTEVGAGKSRWASRCCTSEGVKAMTDPDVVVVHVTVKQLEAEAAAPAVAAEAAEPEVIGRVKAEEEETEEK